MKRIIALFKRYPFLFLPINILILSYILNSVQIEPWLELVMVILFSFVVYSIEINIINYLYGGKIKIRTIEQIIDETWKKHRDERQREMGNNRTIKECKK